MASPNFSSFNFPNAGRMKTHVYKVIFKFITDNVLGELQAQNTKGGVVVL